MPTNQETFEAMVATTQKFYPKYRVIAKKDSRLHRFIGAILKTFTPNKQYMTHYWTYFANKNAYPLEEREGEHYDAWAVHIHEGTHSGQEHKFSTPIWGSLYLLGTPVPAVVSLFLSIPFFVVGALVSGLPWWSGFLVLAAGIILSSPVPFAYWRSEWELQAYGASIAMHYWRYGDVPDDLIEDKVRIFAGGEYFYMNVFKSRVRKRLQKAAELVKAGKFITKWLPRSGEFYAACYQTAKDHGRLTK